MSDTYFLGIRCSNTDFAYAILSGTRLSPKVVSAKCTTFPKSYNESATICWLRLEIKDIIGKSPISKACLKKSEATRNTNSLQLRLLCEGAIISAIRESMDIPISRKVQTTLAKDLGAKGKAKYLKGLDYSVFSDWDNYSDKVRESILAAWSCMPL